MSVTSSSAPSRAVLIVQEAPAFSDGAARSGDVAASGATAQLVGRPFLEHVIEHLADAHLRSVDVIVCGTLKGVRDIVGDGRRWGLELRLHSAADIVGPWECFRALEANEDDGPVLVGFADRLPSVVTPDRAFHDFLPINTTDDDWTGWAWVQPSYLRRLAFLSSVEQMEALCRRRDSVVCADYLDFRTTAGLLHVHRRFLAGQLPDLVVSGHEEQPGIVVGRRVRVHATAKVEGPVWIGSHARIEAGAQVGPWAVIGAGSVVERESVVRHSVVTESTYVGGSLTLEEVLVTPGSVHDPDRGYDRTIDRGRTAGAVSRPASSFRAVPMWERLPCAALALLTAPVMLVSAVVLFLFRKGPLLRRLRFGVGADEADGRCAWVFGCPAQRKVSSRRSAWMDLLLFVIPGLVGVACGQLSLIGVAPRVGAIRREVATVWEEVAGAGPGLVFPGLLIGAEPVDHITLAIADASYCATPGRMRRPATLIRYLSLLVRA